MAYISHSRSRTKLTASPPSPLHLLQHSPLATMSSPSKIPRLVKPTSPSAPTTPTKAIAVRPGMKSRLARPQRFAPSPVQSYKTLKPLRLPEYVVERIELEFGTFDTDSPYHPKVAKSSNDRRNCPQCPLRVNIDIFTVARHYKTTYGHLADSNVCAKSDTTDDSRSGCSSANEAKPLLCEEEAAPINAQQEPRPRAQYNPALDRALQSPFLASNGRRIDRSARVEGASGTIGQRVCKFTSATKALETVKEALIHGVENSRD